jgi:hypothetical protein
MQLSLNVNKQFGSLTSRQRRLLAAELSTRSVGSISGEPLAV